jgi:phage host-nuclease inhibitor protein Gam
MGRLGNLKKTFKFENWWLKEHDFHNYAKSVWITTKNKAFSNRTNQLAGQLKIWCKKKKPLQQQINNLEDQIKQIQLQPLHSQDHNKEAHLVKKYEQAMTKLTDSYMQRAKKNWIKDGDRNTSFFHRAIVKRRRRKTILSVRDENNVLHYMPDKISNTFVNYF